MTKEPILWPEVREPSIFNVTFINSYYQFLSLKICFKRLITKKEFLLKEIPLNFGYKKP